MPLRNYFPALDWLRDYRREWLPGDLSAGLTVGVMLIPQGMAYAMLAGLPPIHGLYAATLPLILYAFLGTSRQLAVGPVAMDSLLTAVGVGAIATAGTEQFVALAAALAFLVGSIQLLGGVLRLGFLINLVSRPVISGFSSAAALIIAASQLPHLLGTTPEHSGSFAGRLIATLTTIPELHAYTLALGTGGILLMVVLRRWNRKIPAPLILVFLAVGVVYGWELAAHGVRIVGDIPAGLPAAGLALPGLDQLAALLPTAAAIALVSLMESLGVGLAVERQRGERYIVPNQELIAVGAANLGNALVGGFPGAGGFSRTAVNDQAGAKTQLAAIISAAVVLLTLLFLTPLFYYLPTAVLASIIMVAVLSLVDVATARELWHRDRSDFWMLAVTFVATLVLGIQWGIGVGVGLSLAVHVYRGMQPHVAVLGRLPGTEDYRNVARYPEAEQVAGTLVVRFDGRLYFANVTYFRQQLAQRIAARDELHTLVVNAEGIASLDSSAVAELTDLIEEQNGWGRRIIFAGLIGPVRDIFRRNGLFALVGEQNFFLQVSEAMRAVSVKGGAESDKDYALQTNFGQVGTA
ncbi:MAG: sulfate permease [Bacteroidota bacterium]